MFTYSMSLLSVSDNRQLFFICKTDSVILLFLINPIKYLFHHDHSGLNWRGIYQICKSIKF